MARNTGLHETVGIARSTTGGVIAADSATLTDANIPPAQGISCSAFDTILVGVEIDAGTNPTATIEALVRDEEAADGSRWKRLLLGAPDGVTLSALANETTGALTGTSFAELRVYGRQLVFLRITAVTNATSTTGMRILVAPGRRRPRA